MNKKYVKVLRITGKTLAWILASVLALLLILILIIRLPAVQDKIVNTAETFFKKKTGRTLQVDHVYLQFPKTVSIKGLYIEDQYSDTLLYLNELKIDASMWSLLDHEIALNHVSLNGIRARMLQKDSSGYNFQYIINTFSSSDSTSTKDTTSVPWVFSLNQLDVNDLSFDMTDNLNALSMHTLLQELELDFEAFDLDNMHFEVDELNIDGLTNQLALNDTSRQTDTIRTSKAIQSEDTTSITILADEINIQNSHLTVHNNTINQQYEANIHELIMEALNFSLADQKIVFNSFQLNKSKIVYLADEVSAGSDTTTTANADTANTWSLRANTIEFRENDISFQNGNTMVPKGAINFQNLDIHQLSTELSDLAYNTDSIKSDVRSLSFTEKNSGFTIDHFQTSFLKYKQEFSISDLSVQTQSSDIKGNAVVSIANASNPDFNIKLKSTTISPKDILFFMPHLDTLPQFLQWPDIRINTSVAGNMDAINIDTLAIQTDSSAVAIAGKVLHPTQMKNLKWDLPSLKLSLSGYDIKLFLSDSILPEPLLVPSTINADIKTKGSIKAATFKSKIHLSKGVGDIAIDAALHQDSLQQMFYYEGNAQIDHLRAKKIWQGIDLDTIDLTATIKGQAKSMETIAAEVQLDLKHAIYNEYAYKNLQLNGNISSHSFNGALNYKDDNLEIEYDGNIQFSDSLKQLQFNLNIPKADLQALHFSSQPFQFRTKINSDVNLLNNQSLSGNLTVNDLSIVKDDQFYILKNLELKADTTQNENTLDLISDALDIHYVGTVSPVKLPKLIQNFTTYYFNQDSASQKASEKIKKSHFRFNVELKSEDLLKNILIPKLDSIDIAELSGSFSGDSMLFKIDVDIPGVHYAGLNVDSLEWHIANKKNYISGRMQMAQIKMGNLAIKHMALDTDLKKDSLLISWMIKDTDSTDLYKISGWMQQQNNQTEWTFNDHLILNTEKWTVHQPKPIPLAPSLWVDSLQFEHDSQAIGFQTKANGPDTLHQIQFQQFDLKALSNKTTEEAKNLLSGILNGKIQLHSDTTAGLSAQLTINDLAYRDIPWGNLTTKVSSDNNVYTASLELKGENNIQINGKIPSGADKPFNADINFSPIQLDILQPFLKAQVDSIGGTLEGKLKISGQFDNPKINGQLTTNQVKITPSLLGATFGIDQQSIQFSNNTIEFNNFEITDANNSTARLNGNIKLEELSAPTYQLNMKAKNFLVIDKKPDDDAMFYGELRLSNDATIKGSNELISINANVDVGGNSDLVYVLPQESSTVANRNSVVRFVDKDIENDPFFQSVEVRDTIESDVKDISIHANLAVSDKSTLSIVLDPKNGDQLNLNGNGNLTFEMSPTGDIQLTGRYAISKGNYTLNFYQLVKRKFEIKSGSSLLWTGDPVDAKMDITAQYRMKATPPVGSTTAPVTFDVNLNLEGEMLDPDIGFEIDAPEDVKQKNTELYAWLQNVNSQESERNKQAFAMLVFRSFLNTDRNEGINAETTARNSVSQILTQQLNTLGSQLKGVELNFDIDSYQTYNDQQQSSGRTDLELGIGKSFLDNRVTVKVSGNINVEGSDQSENTSDYAGDLMIEYKLTPDGRYRLQGFRQNNYDGLTQGEVTETGVGIIFVREYTAFKELFKKTRKEKKEQSK